MNTNFFRMALLLIIVASGSQLMAQVQTDVPAAVPGAKPVTVERIKIHGKVLEGNLEGNAVDRDVLVFLPPSYGKDKSRHYPVVYALHGYSIGAEQWAHEIHLPQTIEGAFALFGRGKLRRKCLEFGFGAARFERLISQIRIPSF